MRSVLSAEFDKISDKFKYHVRSILGCVVDEYQNKPIPTALIIHMREFLYILYDGITVSRFNNAINKVNDQNFFRCNRENFMEYVFNDSLPNF